MNSKEKYYEQKFGGPDIPLLNWYSEGILIQQKEPVIKREHVEPYPYIDKNRMRKPTNKKYTIETTDWCNYKGLGENIYVETEHDHVVIDGDTITADGSVVSRLNTYADEHDDYKIKKQQNHGLNVFNNQENRYEYFVYDVRGKYPTKEEYLAELQRTGIH